MSQEEVVPLGSIAGESPENREGMVKAKDDVLRIILLTGEYAGEEEIFPLSWFRGSTKEEQKHYFIYRGKAFIAVCDVLVTKLTRYVDIRYNDSDMNVDIEKGTMRIHFEDDQRTRFSHIEWQDSGRDSFEGIEAAIVEYDIGDSIFEGRPIPITHIYRERSQKLVQLKKIDVRGRTGRLQCEACDFNFEEAYPGLGQDFCEVHHLSPLSKSGEARKIEIGDLAVLCSNCHRMIHRYLRMNDLEEVSISVFRSLISKANVVR